MLDGDQVMALIATSWHGCGRLRGNGVVATVMSNLGFDRHLSGLGLSLARTAVGDRYVVDYIRTPDYNPGGGPSGQDRNGVVKGQWESVRVDRGGRRIINQKKKQRASNNRKT